MGMVEQSAPTARSRLSPGKKHENESRFTKDNQKEQGINP
jgi:hypothetical protein